ncbi:MAG: hypothetical protein QM730_26990 [Anaerolineales bacterium]
MSTRFTPETRFLWKGTVYLVKEALENDKVLLLNQSSGGQQVTAISDLLRDLYAGELRFEVFGKIAKRDPNVSIATKYTIADFDVLLEKYRKEAYRRYELILPLLKLPPEERTRKTIEEYVKTLHEESVTYEKTRKRGPVGTAKSRASIERYLRDFEESDYDICALSPYARPGAHKGRLLLAKEVEDIIQDVLNDCKNRPSKRRLEDIHLKVVHEISKNNRTRPKDLNLLLPSKATIVRRVNAYGSVSVLERRQTRAQLHKNDPSFGGIKVSQIMQRVEIDNTDPDLIVVDEDDRLPIGRCVFQLGIDHFSGYPFGLDLSFEPPGYRSTMRCLKYGIMFKPDVQQLYSTKNPFLSYGKPDVLVTDNGSEYVNRSLNKGCQRLRIGLEQVPVKLPWLKAKAERFFRTVNTGLFQCLPGSTFAEMLEKAEYDPKKYSVISLSALEELIHVFLLDDYAISYHKGVKGIPAEIWQLKMHEGFVPANPPNREELDIALFQEDERTIQARGIEYENLFYQGDNIPVLRELLKRAEKSSATIKVDPSNLGYLYILNPLGQGEWFKFHCIEPEYAIGLSLWKHRLICKNARQTYGKVDIVSLADTRARIQEIIDREYSKTNKLATRTRMARYIREDSTNPITIVTSSSSNADKLLSTNIPPQPLLTDGSKPEVDELEFENIRITDEDKFGGSYNLPSNVEKTQDD